MFKKISVYLTVLALVIGPSLMGSTALADNGKNKSDKNQEKKEAKLAKEENKLLGKLFKNWSKQSELEDEDEDNDYDYKNDDRLPGGLRHAPGIEKRVESGKGLPFGWWFKLFGNWPGNNGGNGTTTPPTTNFVLNNIAASVGTSTASISWSTNKAANSKLVYDTVTPLNASSSEVSNGNLVFNHSLSLSGLTPNTTYYYQVTSTTNGGNTATSSTLNFTTNALPVADTEAPNIVFSTIIGITESAARFIWVTNEASNSQVWVGTSTPLDLSSTPTAQNAGLAYYHDLTVNGLTASTTYHYVLGSTDNSANTATSSDSTFNTN